MRAVTFYKSNRLFQRLEQRTVNVPVGCDVRANIAFGVIDNMRSPKMRSLVSDSSLPAHSNASNHQSTTIPSSSPSLGLNSVQSTSSEPTISELSPRTPVSPVKRTRTGNQVFAPVQEQDAGVTLLDGSRLEEHSTLPPAYDSSWMRN